MTRPLIATLLTIGCATTPPESTGTLSTAQDRYNYAIEHCNTALTADKTRAVGTGTSMDATAATNFRNCTEQAETDLRLEQQQLNGH